MTTAPTPNGAAPWHVQAGTFVVDVLPRLMAATMALTALAVPPGSACGGALRLSARIGHSPSWPVNRLLCRRLRMVFNALLPASRWFGVTRHRSMVAGQIWAHLVDTLAVCGLAVAAVGFAATHLRR